MKYIEICEGYFINLNSFSEFYIHENNRDNQFEIRGLINGKDEMDDMLIKAFGIRENAVEFLHYMMKGVS